MIITISGTPGSGKSTIAKILVKKLNAERIYVGGVFRELAREKEMKVEELLEYAKKHTEVDIEVDEKTRDRAKELAKKKDIIVEGRVQFHFLPESVKIFIKVDPKEGAKRIWKDLQDEAKSEERNEELVSSSKETEEKVMKREEEDAKRYEKLYGVDYRNESQYDFVLDTTNITAEEAAEKVMEFIENNK